MEAPPTSTDAPIQHPGPVINNEPTTTTILTASQLRASEPSFLPGLYTTINTAFDASRIARPDLGPPGRPRLDSAADFFTQLGGDDAHNIIVIVHRADSRATVLGTASARRYFGPTAETESVWARREPATARAVEWELKLLATEPALQRQGLAGFMMGVLEAEVARRFVAGDGAREHAARLRMLLTTRKETQEAFYARKGYVPDYEKPRGEGFLFHVIFMSKELVPLRS